MTDPERLPDLETARQTLYWKIQGARSHMEMVRETAEAFAEYDAAVRADERRVLLAAQPEAEDIDRIGEAWRDYKAREFMTHNGPPENAAFNAGWRACLRAQSTPAAASQCENGHGWPEYDGEHQVTCRRCGAVSDFERIEAVDSAAAIEAAPTCERCGHVEGAHIISPFNGGTPVCNDCDVPANIFNGHPFEAVGRGIPAEREAGQ